MLVKNKFGLKFCWANKKIDKKLFVVKKNLGEKNFLVKKFFRPKLFGSQAHILSCHMKDS